MEFKMRTTMSIKPLILSLAIILATSSFSWAAGKTITASEASVYVGKTATVCGYVASAKYAYRSKGKPTFLNLDEPYPRQIFTALIWGNDRPAFGTPETTYSGKNICVTGRIKNYRGNPEIIVTNPKQITSVN
jgi:hypothetical protein